MKIVVSVSRLSKIYLCTLGFLLVFGIALSSRAQSVTWQILPFPENSDWPAYRGQPSVTNGNQVISYGQPVRSAQVFTPPVSFSYDVLLQSRDSTASDGAFWVFLIPPGEATNLNLASYVVPQMSYELFTGQNGLFVSEYPPNTTVAPEVPFNITTGTTYHVTLAIAANGQMTWSVNGQAIVTNNVTVPYSQFQVQIQGWQPSAVWVMNNFTVNTPSTCPNLLGTWSGQMNVVDSRTGYSTSSLSIQVTDQSTNGCLLRGYLTIKNGGNNFPTFPFLFNPSIRVPFTGTIPDGTTVLLNVAGFGTSKASAILDTTQTPPVLSKFIYQTDNGDTITGDLTNQPPAH